MAIGTDDTIVKFGTATSLDNTSGTVADDAFSVAGDLSAFSNTTDAPMASVVFIGTYSVAPTAGSVVNIYCRPMDVSGTKDQNAPTADQPVTFFGSVVLDDVTSEQVLVCRGSLPLAKSSQSLEFYIENKAGQTLGAGWDLEVTPYTFGPSA